uniref:Uncharacterized protein n=1 Tax=Rhizophora mucronata TaxID=61149 RepID=A0A2P2QZH2_RHIMU
MIHMEKKYLFIARNYSIFKSTCPYISQIYIDVRFQSSFALVFNDVICNLLRNFIQIFHQLALNWI